MSPNPYRTSGHKPGVDLAILAAYTGEGGVEKMLNHLMRGFLSAGLRVDLVLLKSKGRHLQGIPPGIRIIPLNVSTSLFALPAIGRYFRTERPRAVLAAKDRAGRVALLARRFWGADTRVVLRMGMHLSASLAARNWFARTARFVPVRWLYHWADAIVTVAEPVALDLAEIGNLPLELFRVIPNPTITAEIDVQAQESPNHPWFDQSDHVPVIVAAGRLHKQKDFPTLIRAFARLREQRPARLIILGDGPERTRIETLLDTLDLRDEVDLPGFRSNPYPFMKRAALFVLSSRYEGAPNVLVEALALGTPVVATDCPSGPNDMLQRGKVGRLVPVGDVEALSTAMTAALNDPADPAALRKAVSAYTVETSTQQYLEVLGLNPDSASPPPHANSAAT